jgi:4-amino-4-deoxy-L-arabinose transferase-like glycosyltransferase
MMQALAGDVHPPLWYLIEYSITHIFGQSEMLLRVPSALFGSMGCLALYALIHKLSGEQAARWGSGLMAVLPGQIYYSQEARMYSLLTLLVIVASYAVIARRWRLMGITFALILFTQTIGAIYVLILAGYSLIISRGASARSCLFGAVAYLPQLPTTLTQLARVNSGYWIPNPGNLGGALVYINFTTLFVRWPAWAQIAAIMASSGFTISAIILLRHEIKRLYPLAILAFGPALLLYIIGLVWKPILLDRALLPSGAFLASLWGIAASKIPRPYINPAAAVSLPILIGGLISYYVDPGQQRPTSNPIIDTIRAGWQIGDVVYHTDIDSVITQSNYLPNAPFFVLPENADFGRGGLTAETREALGVTQKELAFSDLKSRGFRRAWLIGGWTVEISQKELDTQNWILSHYSIIQSWPQKPTKLYQSILYLLRL